MKAEIQLKMETAGFLKRLWCILKRKQSTTITINVEVECEKIKEEVSLKVDVEYRKTEPIDAIAASAKLSKADAGRSTNGLMKAMVLLRNFKAQEPEL